MESNETVAEIVREMRSITFGEECCPDCGADFHRSNQWSKFADRIEAANRREILVERHLADEYLAAKDVKILKLQQRLKTAEDALAAKDDERLTVVANYENVIAVKDRIIAARDAEIEGLQHTLDLHDLYADEECEDADVARIVAEGEADAKDAEIAELRKCLKEAISASRIDCGICNRDCKMKMSFADRTIHNCERIIQWRKALEGANNG